MNPVAIQIENLTTQFGEQIIHQHLNLDILQGEILAIVGGSGSGKSTLLRCILMLMMPTQGRITVLGHDVFQSNATTLAALRRNWGVMFQGGALFSSLTVLENISFVLQQQTRLEAKIIEQMARLKMALVGLPAKAANKYPAELSGGMIKRAAIARAIAIDPALLFLDEPTAGLDPQGAGALDELVLDLKQALGLTVVLVTHDMDTLWRVTDRVAFIGERKVIGLAHIEQLSQMEHPLIKAYFNGPRGKAAYQRQTG